MEHIAIDVGARESQVCIRKADGTIVEERRIRTKSNQRNVSFANFAMRNESIK